MKKTLISLLIATSLSAISGMSFASQISSNLQSTLNANPANNQVAFFDYAKKLGKALNPLGWVTKT